jgi:hypothetical protein
LTAKTLTESTAVIWTPSDSITPDDKCSALDWGALLKCGMITIVAAPGVHVND